MYNECISPSSTRSTRTTTTKIRSPICCIRADAVVEPKSITGGGNNNNNGQRTPRSPYKWLKSTAQELEIRDRCRRVKTRIYNCSYSSNNNCVHYHQRHQSHSYPCDFTYDPLSYSLNFEDDVRAADDDGSFPDFTARLPASPVTKSRSPTVDLISF